MPPRIHFLKNAISLSLRDLPRGASTARNDNQNGISKKVDSSKSLSDSKILDEKCGLQGKSQGSYLSGDLWDFSPLPHLSSKAQSPQVDSSNDYFASAKSRNDGVGGVDCHATATALARNDRNNATILNELAKDSRIFDKNAKNVSKQPKDSRILELESGFFKRAQGRILEVCNRSACAEIDDSSPKAESTSPKQD